MASIPPPPSDPSSASTASTSEPLPSFEVASPPAAGEAASLPTAGLVAPAGTGSTALPSMPPPAPRRHTAELPPVPRLDDSAIASARTLPPMSDSNRPTLPPARGRSLLASTLAQLRRYEDSARKYLPPDLRKKVEKVPRGALLGASLGAGLCLIGAVAVTSLATYRALSSPPEAAATTSRSEPVARSAAQLASPADPNAKAASAHAAAASVSKTAAPAPKSDEASVLLELADTLIAQRREADVIPILERLITRQPELKDDPRVARILMATAAVEERRAAAGSYALLTSAMGESGAALMYELSQKRDVREGVRRRAATWLDSKEFERVAPLTVYAAVRLRKAETCEEKHALLDFAGKAGGKYVLAYLQELDRKKLCAADDLVNCYPCMRNDSLLGDTIAKLERSTAP